MHNRRWRYKLAMDTTTDSKLGARHAPLTKLVLAALRERILSGELAPGERLVEGRLSEELGVSRMPVREALRALAAEGIVVIEPRRGATVTSFTPEQIREMVEVRATLEALNAKLAARRHDPAQIARLERILAEGTRLTSEDDLTRISALNLDFHEALGSVAANSVLQEMMRSLRERTALFFTVNNRERMRQNWEEHAAILRAVVAGDAELASLLAARHVYSAAELPAALEEASTPSGEAAH
ncbi:GntR family transcriptional regulator [Variovorax sp. LARHSF232]